MAVRQVTAITTIQTNINNTLSMSYINNDPCVFIWNALEEELWR